MNVRILKRVLEKLEDDTDIIIDHDPDEGAYELDCFEIITNNSGDKVLNIVNSQTRKE